MADLIGNDPLTISMRKYLSWLAVSHFSELTVKTRRKQLLVFRTWCHEREMYSAQEVSRRVLQQYRRFLFQKQSEQGSTLKAVTQGCYLTAVRVFFSWLVRQNILLANPSSELELPRTGTKLPQKVLKPAEVEQVMELPDLTTTSGLRDRAILETLYSTGIRRLELVRLAVSDVDFDKGLLFVRNGKGGHDRMVPIGRRALSWIEKYLADARPTLLRQDDCQALFVADGGGSFNPDVLTNSVSRYLSKAGFAGSCHLFRHSMATAMLENGADIRSIQMILGHASLDTTQVYTRVTIVKLREVHAQTHPARLKKDLAEDKHDTQMQAEEMQVCPAAPMQEETLPAQP